MKLSNLTHLQPMSSAPLVGPPVRLLVLDQYTEMDEPVHVWTLVHWLEAFDGRPAGWYGENCGDLRNPQGWVAVLPGGNELEEALEQGALKATELDALPESAPMSFELLIDCDDDADISYAGGAPLPELSALITGASSSECRQKLRAFLAKLAVAPREHKQRYSQELTGYLADLAKEKNPSGFRAGGNRTVSFQPALRHDYRV